MRTVLNETGKVLGIQSLKLQHELAVAKQNVSKKSFADALNRELENKTEVHFSKHAAERFQQRGMVMTESLGKDLAQAVEKARQKGSKDTVIIGRGGAFIVNIPSNLIITTMTEEEMKENIFTNIDSAVLL